jgi:hypothetical protein
VRIRFSCGNPQFALSRVLAAKGAIRVIEGARLRHRLDDEIDALRRMYD